MIALTMCKLVRYSQICALQARQQLKAKACPPQGHKQNNVDNEVECNKDCSDLSKQTINKDCTE